MTSKKLREQMPVTKREDDRITAPLISWRVALVIFAVMYFLVVGQAFIVAYTLDRLPMLIGSLSYYLFGASILLSVFFGLFWRYAVGRPLKRIARAARKVATGDFSIQLDPFRKDGKKDEVEVLIDDFNTMTRQLASTEILKSDFIANVSHEIKTPLSIIQSYTKAMKDPSATEKQRNQYADTIIEAAQSLNAMITNILKLNKLEHQEIHPTPETYQLGEQLRQCALGQMDSWLKKKIDFTIDVADVAVHYDASLLELVWNNLLSNAIKYTPNGGHISLTSRIQDNYVIVSLSDTGCGISAEDQKHIFDKFYQADPSRSSEGNGLGLALVQTVLKLVGGEITVDSVLGKGSVFHVKLKI